MTRNLGEHAVSDCQRLRHKLATVDNKIERTRSVQFFLALTVLSAHSAHLPNPFKLRSITSSKLYLAQASTWYGMILMNQLCTAG
jgi:hypothetical protein